MCCSCLLQPGLGTRDWGLGIGDSGMRTPATLFESRFPSPALLQLAANFSSLIASKFCTPPPTRFVV
jgi:hypothetical protein